MDNQHVKRRKINGIIQNCLIQKKKEEKRRGGGDHKAFGKNKIKKQLIMWQILN